MSYKLKITVDNHDIDYCGIVRPSSMMRYMQSAATRHLDSVHPNSDEMRRDLDLAFILSRANMSIYRSLHKDDEIYVETWPCEGKGASYMRCARILTTDGDLVSEMVTRWALVEISTKRLVRCSDFTLSLENGEMLELGTPRPAITRDTSFSLLGERTVTYAQTDINGHMNNTYYADMFCDFLDIKDQMVARFCIAYLSEAPMGETLKIYKAPSENGTLFKSVREDGSTNAEAEIILDSI